ncbi:hypothetical protein QWJ34_25720 [Saccharibacillus sp. CPCC 101409]|uniref:hypothetical protein n=1 Tax=Saccharibacillus sp. CPCC 101409 TaxID=3058041 RepID=UPI0026719ECF|nr:hypothetical protein [Saccharibacillus sp. CPCC 101409]MDO3413176.1 hypothetical protein [Saccharibacillus sp. CPCC 101409]
MRKMPIGYAKGPRYVRRKPQPGKILTGVLIVPPTDSHEDIRRDVQAAIAQEKKGRSVAEQTRINNRIAALHQNVAHKQAGYHG